MMVERRGIKMTQTEARNIESTYDQILTNYTDYDYYCSMALTAHLRRINVVNMEVSC